MALGIVTPEGGGEDLERYRRSGMVLSPSPTSGRVLRMPAPALYKQVVSLHTFPLTSPPGGDRPPLPLGGFLGTPIPSKRFLSHPGLQCKKNWTAPLNL